jgi:4-amino-4-deoxychorismate lyase
MFPLVETIKIKNGVPQHLEWHQWRFEKSFYLHYLKPAPFQLKNLITVPKEYQEGIVKLRFLYNEVDCFCQFSSYKPREINRLKLVEDNDIEYSLKYVNREKIEILAQRKKNADDILIIKNNRITDTSFSNIVFFDDKNWETPLYPLLKGTARERLLSRGTITERDIQVKDLSNYKSFKLINALLDFEEQPVLNIENIIY